MWSTIKTWRNQPLVLWLIFVLISIAIYRPILNNFFVSDDFHWLVIAKETPWNLQIFLHNIVGENYGSSYNPLTVIVFKLAYSALGLNYQAYHLISIILHATLSFVVYLLAKDIFTLSKNEIRWTAVTAGFLFALWPTQVETIAWIAVWPHLWAILSYVLSLHFYFVFRQRSVKKYLLYSILCFIAAILFKEISISLPLVFFVWEAFIFSKSQVKKFNFHFIYYLLITAIFFVFRKAATGLLFGYYGRHEMSFRLMEWLNHMGSYLQELITFSFTRIIFFKIIYHYGQPLAIIIAISLAAYFYYLLRQKKWLDFSLVASGLAVLVPLLPLSMHRTTFAGERYIYLTAVFFVIWIVWQMSQIKNIKIWKYTLLIIFLAFSLPVIAYKLDIWDASSKLSRQIVDSYAELNVVKGEKFITAGLPDNLQGAEVFRNNLQQALDLYYPDRSPELMPLFAYVHVSSENRNNSLLKWRKDQKGWFAESVDGSMVVTGITSIELHGVYYELWNYNYQNYLANTIRIIPRDGEIKILSFEKGELTIISE